MIECQLFVACLLGLVKLAPMEVAKLIKQCDVVVYALPTKNPYLVKIGQVLLAKKPIVDPEINLNSPRPRVPGKPEQVDIGPITQPSILFLRRPVHNSITWRRINFYYDIIPMKNDRTPSSFEEYDDYDNKRIRYMRVGNLLNFPTSLNTKYRGYATRDDISKEVNRIYKLQT